MKAIGPGVEKFSIGERVFGQSDLMSADPNQAGLQEYALLDTNFAALIPHQLSFDDAATFPVNGFASFVALFHSSGLGLTAPFSNSTTRDYSQEAILIVGGASNCGQFGLQFARLIGFGKIVTTASTQDPDRVAYLQTLGATHVVDRSALDVESQIRGIVGDGLVYAYDAVNGGGDPDTVSHQLALSVLSSTRSGSIATLLKGKADPVLAAGKKGGFKKSQILGSSHLHKEFAVQFWNDLPKWIEEGRLRPSKVQTIDGLDAKAVNRVLDNYRDGRAVVKTHVHPHASTSSFT